MKISALKVIRGYNPVHTCVRFGWIWCKTSEYDIVERLLYSWKFAKGWLYSFLCTKINLHWCV